MVAVSVHQTDMPSDEDYAGMLAVLRSLTHASVPTLDNHDFALLLRDEIGRLQGGIIAQSRWGGFHIDILALSDALRGLG